MLIQTICERILALHVVREVNVHYRGENRIEELYVASIVREVNVHWRGGPRV
jgi:hypothetical protein